MKLVILISSMILSLSTTLANSIFNESDVVASNRATIAFNLEANGNNLLPHNPNSLPVAIEDITVIEIEEDITFDFDTKKYLPENFNPLKGKYDLDWSKIELIEIEEEVNLGFDVKQYLPVNFNAQQALTYNRCNK